MSDKKLAFFRIVFVMAALWNLAGGIPGYFDSANMFHRLFDKELTDPLMTAIYKGSWGTTFLYFFGYLLVAYNPVRHTGIVILGTIGKMFFAAGLLKAYLSGMTTSFALVVLAGDFIFTALFIAYLISMARRKEGLF
jgi:hypothetical protein